jgi:hypothetical protein
MKNGLPHLVLDGIVVRSLSPNRFSKSYRQEAVNEDEAVARKCND